MNNKYSILFMFLLLLAVVIAGCQGKIIGGRLAPSIAFNNQTNQTNCTDSDGGINISFRGICSDFTGNFTDYCLGSVKLGEYYCGDLNNTGCQEEDIRCPFKYICSNGACIQNKTFINYTNYTINKTF